nr:uncharacterized serine-rich protein C215.13 isoform X2 [Aedes albopictus]XP_029710905.1 uncharacterized serine-rich protein C215.13 isoform X2 [Aedes albopictus]XP_029710906.1 uncharacterized serine-rich protein C215.13 isoform X2 [Aedes albopictus]
MDTNSAEDEENAKENKSLNECFPSGIDAAPMLGSNERLRASGEDPPASHQQQRQIPAISTTTATPPPPSVSESVIAQPAEQPNPASSSSNSSHRHPSRSRSDSADERESVASSTGSTASSASSAGSDIQQHLQSMFYLLRPEETLKMAVKLESLRAGRTRYLVVVSRPRSKRMILRQPQQQLNQQQSTPMAFSCSTTAATSVSSTPLSVSPIPVAIPISKQITSASLYKAASPSTTTGCSAVEEGTFVSSLDNCVLSVLPKSPSASAASVNNNNKSVDKCDSDRPSSSNCVNNNNSNVSSLSGSVASVGRPGSGSVPVAVEVRVV